MSILFMDGFDMYASKTELETQGGWTTSNANISLSVSTGRFNGGAITGTLDDQHASQSITKTLGDTILVSWAYYYTTGQSGFDFMLRLFASNGFSLFDLLHDTGGTVRADGNSGAAVDSVTSPLVGNNWNWVEVKVVLGTSSSTGSWVVKINGVEVINSTSRDTHNGNDMTEVRFFGSDIDWRVDDVVIYDDQGSTNNDFIGDSKIETLSVSGGDGGVAAWTATGAGANNSERVDDTLNAADDDTTYLASTTATQENRVNFGAMAETPTSIHTVQVVSRAKKDDAGAINFRNLINSNANESLGATEAPTTGYTNFRTSFDLNPDGNVAWTKTSVDALEGGVEIV